jgi:hypothetical protein
MMQQIVQKVAREQLASNRVYGSFWLISIVVTKLASDDHDLDHDHDCDQEAEGGTPILFR